MLAFRLGCWLARADQLYSLGRCGVENDKKTLIAVKGTLDGPDCGSDGPRVRTEPHERRVLAGRSRREDTPQFLLTDGLRLLI